MFINFEIFKYYISNEIVLIMFILLKIVFNWLKYWFGVFFLENLGRNYMVEWFLVIDEIFK